MMIETPGIKTRSQQNCLVTRRTKATAPMMMKDNGTSGSNNSNNNNKGDGTSH